MYGVLFLGLPVAGVVIYVWLCRRMAAAGVSQPPTVVTVRSFHVSSVSTARNPS
jgi:hypothetical protein